MNGCLSSKERKSFLLDDENKQEDAASFTFCEEYFVNVKIPKSKVIGLYETFLKIKYLQEITGKFEDFFQKCPRFFSWKASKNGKRVASAENRFLEKYYKCKTESEQINRLLCETLKNVVTPLEEGIGQAVKNIVSESEKINPSSFSQSENK